MITRTIGFAIIAAAALSPSISRAAPAERAALDACVNAFAKSISLPAAATRGYKVVYPAGRFDSSMSSLFSIEYTYELQATDEKTGAAFARARCTASDRGKVSALSALPLAPGPKSPALTAGL